METDHNELITAPAAAEILGLTRQYITQLCREGKIPSARQMQPGGWWVMRREDIERLREERNDTK